MDPNINGTDEMEKTILSGYEKQEADEIRDSKYGAVIGVILFVLGLLFLGR
jgi:hypothetical protein